MTLALLFPGQGAQRPGMLHTLPGSDEVTATLTEAQAICADLALGPDLDSAEQLRDTVATQISLLTAGVACARGLIVDYGVNPQFVAGHSVGAFAAAVIAEVLTLREALTAVLRRAEAMRAACAAGIWGMAAITGLSTGAAEQLAISVSTPREPLWVANVNSATQTVLGGTVTALEAARLGAGDAGATAFERLDVAVASHGPVQNGTAGILHGFLSEVPRRTATARYVTNTGGRSAASPDAVLDDLANSVARPVRWYDGVRLMTELGVTCTIETPPGHALTRLVASISPGLAAVAVSDEDLSGAAAWARRRR